MIRGVVKGIITAACLASLVLSLGTGWLWWRARAPYRRDSVEVAPAGRYVEAGSRKSGLYVWSVGGWPGAPGLRFRSEGPEDLLTGLEWKVSYSPERRGRWPGGVCWEAGTAQVEVDVRGPPRDVSLAVTVEEFGRVPKPAVVDRPCWTVRAVPHGWAVAAFALPPLLWLGTRGRRALTRRRRVRRGLCAACGYDLTGNASGWCPECGAAVPGAPR